MSKKRYLNISIVIPTLNRSKSLNETFNSIFSKNTLPREVLVLDQSDEECFINNQNNINSLSLTVVTKIIHIKCDFKSLTKARNCGLNKSTSEIVLFLDDDVCFHNDCLNFLNDYFEKKEIGLVGCINCREKLFMPSVKSRFAFGIKNKVKTEGVVSKSVLGFFPSQIQSSADTDWAMGFCFAIKRSIALANNIFFDEKLTGYAFSEDLDYTYRYISELKRRNMKGIFCNDAIVEHLVSLEYRIPLRKNACMFLVNRLYLFFKLSFEKRWIIYYKMANIVYSQAFNKDKKTKRWFVRSEKELLKNYKTIKDFADLDKIYQSLLLLGEK